MSLSNVPLLVEVKHIWASLGNIDTVSRTFTQLRHLPQLEVLELDICSLFYDPDYYVTAYITKPQGIVVKLDSRHSLSANLKAVTIVVLGTEGLRAAQPAICYLIENAAALEKIVIEEDAGIPPDWEHGRLRNLLKQTVPSTVQLEFVNQPTATATFGQKNRYKAETAALERVKWIAD